MVKNVIELNDTEIDLEKIIPSAQSNETNTTVTNIPLPAFQMN